MLARAMRHSESSIQSVFSGEVPFILHTYKNGDKHIKTDYRPISSLPSFSKVSVKLIFTRLPQNFTNNNILSKEQCGFKSNSSTDNAIFKLLNEILNALNNKLTIGGIFWDLEKALNCVDHNILLSELHYYRIMGSMYTLIQSYLTGRYQHVVINSKISNHNIHSKWDISPKGVPHGSILGP